jgi:hypothetical protein
MERLFSRQFGIAIVSTTALAFASSCWAQSSARCPGPNYNPHPYGNFDFETNSRVERANYQKYKFEIVSCVVNHDKVYPIYVRWFIPGFNGWVPRALASIGRRAS